MSPSNPHYVLTMKWPSQAHIWTFVPQLAVLFVETVSTIRGGAWLEEVDLQGQVFDSLLPGPPGCEQSPSHPPAARTVLLS